MPLEQSIQEEHTRVLARHEVMLVQVQEWQRAQNSQLKALSDGQTAIGVNIHEIQMGMQHLEDCMTSDKVVEQLRDQIGHYTWTWKVIAGSGVLVSIALGVLALLQKVT